ncbi:MAG: pseudouridine synthase [Maricaulaceae bacterium]
MQKDNNKASKEKTANEKTSAESAPTDGERIAKVLARAGIASRRDAEKLIEAGRVTLNGKVLRTPAVKVTSRDKIEFDGRRVNAKEATRLWRYHKPSGLLTSHKDPQGRPTVFEHLPEGLPRVISVGRLDMTSEGLLLLTNDGELARMLELPSTAWARRYRARAYGRITQDRLDTLKRGITIDGVPTGPIEASIDRQQGDNVWIDVTLREGKNREVRRALDTVGLRVNRLIRVSYGPFQLATLPSGDVEEVKNRVLRDQVGHLMEIEKTRQGGTLTGNSPKGKKPQKSGRPNAGGRTGDKPMPQGKGRNAKPKRKVPGGRDLSTKAAKQMISSRKASIAAKGNPSKANRNTAKPSGNSSNSRPNNSRGNSPRGNAPRGRR